jgi:hypothetical protein
MTSEQKAGRRRVLKTIGEWEKILRDDQNQMVQCVAKETLKGLRERLEAFDKAVGYEEEP